MKKYTKQTLLAVALLGSLATSSMADSYAYDIDFKGASVKKADFNPYWFEEKEAGQEYAYEATSKDAPVYREFKEGDFNPYGFED